MLIGSPPLTRERQAKSECVGGVCGITHAYAGKTKLYQEYMKDVQDHPRLRGKDRVTTQLESVETGSPPLTRERHYPYADNGMYVRITPAYAGKTIHRAEQGVLPQDHPRLRGKDLRR